jgi:hypothetical protein
MYGSTLSGKRHSLGSGTKDPLRPHVLLTVCYVAHTVGFWKNHSKKDRTGAVDNLQSEQTRPVFPDLTVGVKLNMVAESEYCIPTRR